MLMKLFVLGRIELTTSAHISLAVGIANHYNNKRGKYNQCCTGTTTNAGNAAGEYISILLSLYHHLLPAQPILTRLSRESPVKSIKSSM